MSTRPASPSQRLTRIAQSLDVINERIGHAVSWLSLALVLLIAYDVAMRYLFHAGSVALQELEWHLFALLFLLSAGYTLKHDEHVRVDIIYQRLHPRVRALIDVGGAAFFLIPFALLIGYSAWPFVYDAFMYGEGSSDPGGLPYRYLLKAAIPVAMALLIVQALATIARNLAMLVSKRREIKPKASR